MILGDKITNLRKKAGWSQEELAHQLGVSRQAVSKWESGSSIPDLDKILRLSQLFEVSTDYLLLDEMEPELPQAEPEPVPILDGPQVPVHHITLEQANTYLDTVRGVASKIALGVFLCILSPTALIYLGGLSSEEGRFTLSEPLAGGVGILVMLALVSAAVALFLFFGSRLTPYEHLDNQPVELAYGVDGVVKKRQAEYQTTHLMLLVVGITLCILSLAPLMILVAIDENGMAPIIGLILMFVLVAVGVFLLVRTCIIAGSFQRLLETGDYTREHKREENSPLTTIYWGLVLAIYLGWSFWTMAWDRTWIVWPVAAVLYAPVRSIAGLLTKK